MFPLVHSQKKLRSKEKGPINQEGIWGTLEIRGEISSRVLIEISGLKVMPSESQGAESGLLSFCVGWERCFLGLSASTLGCFSIISVEVTVVLPWGGFCSDIYHERLLFSITLAKAREKHFQTFTSRREWHHCFSWWTPASGRTCSCLEQMVTALRWPLRTFLIAPQQGTAMTLTLEPLHLSPQWLWDDYVDKGQRC